MSTKGGHIWSDTEHKTLCDFSNLILIWGEDFIIQEVKALAEMRDYIKERREKYVTKPPRKALWSAEDLKILQEQYPIKGSAIPELRKKFTMSQIQGRASNLHLHVGKGNGPKGCWDAQQIELLRARYPLVGHNIPELLQVFSATQIINKAHKLGISMTYRMTDSERALLIKEYPTKGADIPELLSKYPRNIIISRARSLKLKKNPRWTAEDIEILKAEYPIKGWNIPALLIKFTKNQIGCKARMLYLKSNYYISHIFTEEEITILRRDFPEKGTDIPELLQRHTHNAIQAKAYNLGLHMIDHR